jgi:hypothetical protein
LLLGDEAQLRPARDRDRGAGLEGLGGRPGQEAHTGPQERSTRKPPVLEAILRRRLDGGVNRPDVLAPAPTR